MSNPVVPSYEYYAKPDQGRPVFSGYIYIGEAGTDPSITENQIEVRKVQADGSEVAVPQPLQLSPGGLILVNDSPAKIVADSSFSIAVYGKDGTLQTYDPNSYPDQKCIIGGDTDPNPEFKIIVDGLDVQPITWLRGWRGIVNDGTGNPAAWADYEGQDENDNGLLGGLDTESSIPRESMNFEPLDDWTFDLVGQPWTQTGGQAGGPGLDAELKNTPTSVSNHGGYNTSVECNGPFGIVPYGWPITWSMRGEDVYNQSTDPGVPTSDPAYANYTVRDGNSGGTLLHSEQVFTTDPNGPAVTIPQRTDTDYIYLGGIYMQNWITCVYDFADPDPGPPFTTITSVYSALGCTPKYGQLTPTHEIVAGGAHTVSAYFQFKLAHPLGIDIDSDQIIWAAGETRLFVEKTGTIKFQPEDGVTHTVGSVALNDYAVVVIQQLTGQAPIPYNHRAYLNGVEVFDINEQFWRVDVEPKLWTGGDWRGASAPVALANRRPMVAGFSEYVMWDVLIDPADILAMSNALLGT